MSEGLKEKSVKELTPRELIGLVQMVCLASLFQGEEGKRERKETIEEVSTELERRCSANAPIPNEIAIAKLRLEYESRIEDTLKKLEPQFNECRGLPVIIHGIGTQFCNEFRAQFKAGESDGTN